MSAQITLRIRGEDLSPDRVPLGDFLALLQDFHAALAASARARKIPKEELHISLTSVEAGSEVLRFTANDSMQRQAFRVVAAIADDDAAALPVRARDSIRGLWRKASARKWTIEIDAQRQRAVRKATIDPLREPFIDNRATGTTSRVAYILRAGGEKPTAQIKLADGRKLTARVSNRNIAEELGHHLYHWTELRGEGRWSVKTLRLDEFVITGLGPYFEKGSDPIKALDDLGRIAGNAWAKIDPADYLRDLRSDD